MVVPVFAAMILHVVPPLIDLSTLYPPIGGPPAGGECHERLICEDETNGVVSPVGGALTVSIAGFDFST